MTASALPGLLELVPFQVAMNVRFRGVTRRAGVLVGGPAGWGEFSPFDEYGPQYAARWLACAVEAATVPSPPVRRDTVAVNTTVPAVDPATAHRMVAGSGCATAKVKVAEPGQDLAADVERVAAVRDALGRDGRVRVDANGAWDVETAVLAIRRLHAAADLEYVEQPCATISEMAELRRRIEVPLAADESVRTARDPSRVARAQAADLVVVKVQPLGGLAAVLEIVDASGLPAVVSSAIETSVGLAVGMRLAASLPELDHACGLATASLLATDVVADPLLPAAGSITLRDVVPDRGLLERAAPEPGEAAELLARLAAAAAHLPGEARQICELALERAGDATSPGEAGSGEAGSGDVSEG